MLRCTGRVHASLGAAAAWWWWCCVASYRLAAPKRTTALRDGDFLLVAFVEPCDTRMGVGAALLVPNALDSAGFC